MMKKRACDNCARRKILCHLPGSEGPCDWCRHHNLTCTFQRLQVPRRRRTRVKSTPDQSLIDRLDRVERALASTIAAKTLGDDTLPAVGSPRSGSIASPTGPLAVESNETSPDDRYGPSLAEHLAENSPLLRVGTGSPVHLGSSFGQIHYDGFHLGQISCYNGLPVLTEQGQAWVFARTGQDASTCKLDLFGGHRARQASSLIVDPHEQPESQYELPERALVEQALDTYASSSFRLVFPVLDRRLFQDAIEQAYRPMDAPPRRGAITARCSVFAFLSIASLFSARTGRSSGVDGDVWAGRAHRLLPDVLEEATLLSLQTVFMLHMHQNFSGRLQSAAVLHSAACRLVYALGGHMRRQLGPYGREVTRADRESRQLRVLFWLCFILDKDIALRSGQPPLLDEDYCDLDLPSDHAECYSYLGTIGEDLGPDLTSHETFVPYFPGDPRLSLLKDKTSRMLYSSRASRKSDADILRDIRELDEELEAWRQSLPQDFRPSLSVNQKSHPISMSPKLPRKMQQISLHMEYHYLVTTIHQASGRCLNRADDDVVEEGHVHRGIQSSIALALEASRSTLYYLKSAIHGLAGEAFWLFVFYPTAAIMPLFLNILMYPSDPQVKVDLELLSSAADLIRGMPVRRLTDYEIGHMKMINDFVTELIRLGHCAIARATS